jgi:hypothetical protein
MIEPLEDYRHHPPPQAFMTWKENWVFPALDREASVASLFHISLRPGQGEGVFTAKFCIAGEEHRYVGRTPLPASTQLMQPVENERMRFEVVEPDQRFAIRYLSAELEAELEYSARWPSFDFRDGPLAPGPSVLGDLGRAVFHYPHYEQALTFVGRITFKSGPRAGETIDLSGYANRDHSWGWRSEFSFHYHHWLTASFADTFVGASVCRDDYYALGPKTGGWISAGTRNDAIASIDLTDGHPLEKGMPLPYVARDVRYAASTVSGRTATVVAHLGSDYGRLYLDARSRDRTKTYQDVQVFCDMTLEETGQRGTGVLEVGQLGVGAGIADTWRRTASAR